MMLFRMVIACAVAAITGAVPRTAAATEMVAATAGDCASADTVAVDESTRQRATATVLCLVNRQRTRYRRKLLRPSALLDGAATTHSNEMVARRYFSHSSPSGRGVRHRATVAGYVRKDRYVLVDETIAWGSGPLATPAELVQSFIRSSPHRRTLLDPKLRDVGIGLTLGAPVTDAAGPAATLTLDFGRRYRHAP